MADIHQAIVEAIQAQLQDAEVQVEGEGGHFTIAVKSAAFAGKNTLGRHRLVLGAIKDLMAGADAPVHAVDSIKTEAP